MQTSGHILVVDDEEQIRKVLKEYLTNLGHEVDTAQDGFEALAKLALGFDLVMLDVNMPGMDGFEVARRIRNEYDAQTLPIIQVTGMSTRQDRIRAVEAGANDFIAKPIDFTEVSVRTSSLLKMKHAHDALKRHKVNLEETIAQRTNILRKALNDMVEAQRLHREATLETIHRLVAATEYKDRDTAGHIQRMSHYSALIARKINLPPGEVELILHASPMHDIGKIGTPEEILFKPEKLSDEEWRLMKQHTVIGGDILKDSNSDLLKVGQMIALTHHEKWNGSGYPNNLSGNDIHIWGRITAVADVYDACTSERPYKRAFTTDETLKILMDGAGSHFDASLVQVFVENFDEVQKIQAERSQ